MTLPAWPAINDTPLEEGFQAQPWGPGPIITQMEGGNVRTRRRPGDNITFIKQTIRMSASDMSTFKSWFTDTLGGGAARFTMDVWTGTAFENKVCQFDLANPLQETVLSDGETTDVAMSLRVYI